MLIKGNKYVFDFGFWAKYSFGTWALIAGCLNAMTAPIAGTYVDMESVIIGTFVSWGFISPLISLFAIYEENHLGDSHV